MSLHRTFVCSALGGAVALMASAALNAATSGGESYPSRPGRLIVPTTPAEFLAFTKAERARWAKVVKDSGTPVE